MEFKVLDRVAPNMVCADNFMRTYFRELMASYAVVTEVDLKDSEGHEYIRIEIKNNNPNGSMTSGTPSAFPGELVIIPPKPKPSIPGVIVSKGVKRYV